MIRISQCRLPISHDEAALRKKIAKTLRLTNGQAFKYEIRRQSVDARNKSEKLYVYTIDVETVHEDKILKRIKGNNITRVTEKPYSFPPSGDLPLNHAPVITGSGPAGLFCAWYLARAGYHPIVIERGDEAKVRKEKVDQFWEGGTLDTESNVQFGEGGAGTFSDGKLNTLVKDPAGRNHEVMRRFIEAGAPDRIAYVHKPHLGTDLLIDIVQRLRREIIDMGGSFYFRTRLVDINIKSGCLRSVTLETPDKGRIEQLTDVLVLAIGHSARDTFEMLKRRNIAMEPKPFAVGVRVEHPQTTINQALYGEDENPILGPAPYKVTHTCENGRGVYSFCMCPGGYVVNASSEEGRLAVNGMSYHARDSINANSAIIVSVPPVGEDALSGIEFQRQLEEKAFRSGGGKIPIQLYGDYKAHRPSTHYGSIMPCHKGADALGDVRSIFPLEIGDSIEEGMEAFSKKIPGFNHPDTLLCGVESRTSSPVRILRDKSLSSLSAEGIYPCGEGAGYAGGITSAAMDGIRVAEAIASKYNTYNEN